VSVLVRAHAEGTFILSMTDDPSRSHRLEPAGPVRGGLVPALARQLLPEPQCRPHSSGRSRHSYLWSYRRPEEGQLGRSCSVAGTRMDNKRRQHHALHSNMTCVVTPGGT
jgi:hypothetical protein